MKVFSSKKRVAAVGLVTAATLVGGGVAFAYWTADGTGSGSALTAAGTANLAITQTSAVTNMFPGDSTQALNVDVKNNAANKAYVTSLGAYISTGVSGCDGSDYLINGDPVTGDADTPTPLTWTAAELDAGATVSSENSIQFNNKSLVDQEACKGATVTLHYVAK
jgi:hypothetical protein